jgi:hypothetical protein
MSSGLRSGGDVVNVLVDVQAFGVKERRKDLSIGEEEENERLVGCIHAREVRCRWPLGCQDLIGWVPIAHASMTGIFKLCIGNICYTLLSCFALKII